MVDRNPEQMQLFLDKLLRHSLLSDEEQQAILDLPGFEQKVSAGVDFVGMGERVDHACLIVAGLAGRFGQTDTGDRQIVELHIPGDMADLHSVVVPDSAMPLQAIEDVALRKIPHSALYGLCDRFPAVARSFWRDGIIDLHMVAQTLVSLGRRRADARLACLICELFLRFARIGRGDERGFEFKVTQPQIADMLGLTPVHVNRTLRVLREDGLLILKDSRVEILDWDGLAELAEFDPAYLQLDRVDLHG